MKNYRFMLFGSLLLIVLVFILAAYFVQMQREKNKVLPVYGLDETTLKPPVVKDFSLVNQSGDTITLKSLKDHIYVTNFFFVKCQGICPSMNNQLARVYNEYKGNKEILFISHSVKPEEDSVSALKTYAQLYQADPAQWWFLTGDKKEIYSLARDSYMASISEGDGGPDDFVHTQMLTLVDKEKRLRGFYDGLDTAQVDLLIQDIRVLLNEYH